MHSKCNVSKSAKVKHQTELKVYRKCTYIAQGLICSYIYYNY